MCAYIFTVLIVEFKLGRCALTIVSGKYFFTVLYVTGDVLHKSISSAESIADKLG